MNRVFDKCHDCHTSFHFICLSFKMHQDYKLKETALYLNTKVLSHYLSANFIAIHVQQRSKQDIRNSRKSWLAVLCHCPFLTWLIKVAN